MLLMLFTHSQEEERQFLSFFLCFLSLSPLLVFSLFSLNNFPSCGSVFYAPRQKETDGKRLRERAAAYDLEDEVEGVLLSTNGQKSCLRHRKERRWRGQVRMNQLHINTDLNGPVCWDEHINCLDKVEIKCHPLCWHKIRVSSVVFFMVKPGFLIKPLQNVSDGIRFWKDGLLSSMWVKESTSTILPKSPGFCLKS